MALLDTLVRVPRTEGLVRLHGPGDGLSWLASWRLRLPTGTSATLSTADDEEAVVVLQEGEGTWRFGGRSHDVARSSIFTQRATALYLPPGATVEATGGASTLEAIVVSTPIEAAAPGSDHPVLVAPDAVRVQARGRGGYARHVHDILVDDPHARRLMVGETFNPPGHWSSFPPHKHDGRDGEPVLEEVYHYRLDPAAGFGQQLLYTAEGESVAHTVRDGDAVLLPYGYHPVSSPPGYHLYYLWVLAGDERRLAVFEDPDHRWIHDAG